MKEPEKFTLADDQMKTEVPAAAQEQILWLYDGVVRTRDQAITLQDQAAKADISANIARQAFAEFIAVVKKRLNVPRDWDLTPEASHFYEPREGQQKLLPAQMQAVELPAPPEDGPEEEN